MILNVLLLIYVHFNGLKLGDALRQFSFTSRFSGSKMQK